ncbi:MAG: alpha/beta hydrolase [Candidatus Didemnitutus sp.]|nr:alpha/beta hydrolase [Candidatus Didemnitutus sp.]
MKLLGPFALLVALYLAVCLLARLVAPGMMFLRPPARAPLAPETIRLQTPDGITLHARHWKNPEAKFTLLYFSGNGEELGALASYLPEYVKAGFSVLTYEYRGYGHTQGTPSEANCHADARLLLAWLNENGTPSDRVIAFGFSLGGGSAVELARTEPLAGLVLESTFVSAYRVMTRWPILLGDLFPNERRLSAVHCPVLIVHGTADPVIPDWHARSLYAAANKPKRLVLVPGGGHGGLETVLRDDYWQTLRDFAATLPGK